MPRKISKSEEGSRAKALSDFMIYTPKGTRLYYVLRNQARSGGRSYSVHVVREGRMVAVTWPISLFLGRNIDRHNGIKVAEGHGWMTLHIDISSAAFGDVYGLNEAYIGQEV